MSSRSDSRTLFPIHDLADDLDPDLAEILPAIHALTGCDTASKVGTKSKAVKEGANNGYKLLSSFGRDELSEEMILLMLKSFSSSVSQSMMLTHSINFVSSYIMKNICSLT